MTKIVVIAVICDEKVATETEDALRTAASPYGVFNSQIVEDTDSNRLIFG